ncbi:MAG: type II toxin-antitoxin system RelE/ParE family toxin [bacterium]
MIKKVKFAQEASLEFRDSVDWYESKARGLGLRFTDETDSTIERIKLNPDLYPSVVEDIKRIQLNKFPFSIFYKVENDILVILRIFHNKRKPIEW